MTTPGVSLNDLDTQHLGFAVDLHLGQLQAGLFPKLGPRFLAGYYRSFLESPYGLGLVAELDGTPVGYLVGTTDNAAHYRWVLRHRGVALALVAALPLVRQPKLARHFLRTRVRRYIRGGRLLLARTPERSASASAEPRRAVLTHVAVVPTTRRSGAGRRLVDGFVDRAGGDDAHTVAVVTALGPDGASAFYQRLGWTVLRESVDADGEPVVHLWWAG